MGDVAVAVEGALGVVALERLDARGAVEGLSFVMRQRRRGRGVGGVLRERRRGSG